MRPGELIPVKLVVSAFSGHTDLISTAFSRISERFGPMDTVSGLFDFDSTGYYEEEFGKGLKRRLASFETLIPPDLLPDIKTFTNGIEDGHSEGGRRKVNIDPGYMALEKFVLASCKNFTHRIYLKDGVYADLTMMFTQGDLRDLEWTYPDYKTEPVKPYLLQVRRRYSFQIGKGL